MLAFTMIIDVGVGVSVCLGFLIKHSSWGGRGDAEYRSEQRTSRKGRVFDTRKPALFDGNV